ncbi:MAG: MFS transporter, partial [Pseudonocardiaceae bacterium]
MKRPASPSGGGHPGSRGRGRAGRARRWVPEDWRRGADEHHASGQAEPPPPSSSWEPPPPMAEPTVSSRTRPGRPELPRKITVTRVAAWRSRQLVGDGVRRFHRATTADGAGRSGLSSLTYAAMMDYAASAAIAVALANTLFFSAATAESKLKVALYLLITVAPFALVAPVIGPLLDKVQRGRRVALAASFVGRGALAVVMAFHFNDWG